MKTDLFRAIRFTVITVIVFGVVYPLIITGIAKMTSGGGKGNRVMVNNRVVGFDVIGQSFESDKYFNGRPSAVGYNAAATGGSNKGPTNPDYLAQVEERIAGFLKQNPDVKRNELTVDLVTASGGGLDPHISPRAAEIQIVRIAKARGIAEERIRSLVSKHTEPPWLGVFGTSRVNVLRLNIELDQLK